MRYSLDIMRTSVTTIGISVFAFLIVAAEDTAHIPKRLPKLSDVTEIKLWTPSNWFLHIRRDGSAQMYASATVDDEVISPPNTFVFPDVFDWLLQTVQQGGNLSLTVQQGGTNREFVIVTFETPGKDLVYPPTYARGTEGIRLLFEYAKHHSTAIDPRRIEIVWEKRPPFPGMPH